MTDNLTTKEQPQSMDEETVLFEWVVPEDYPRNRDRCDDVAEAYRVTANEEAASGIVIYAKYYGRWDCNPTNVRPLVRQLLLLEFNRNEDRDDAEDAIASQETKKQWYEDLVQSLLVRQIGEPVTVESWQERNGMRLWGIYKSIYVMNKEDGLFYPDSSPSNRPDNYYELFRWDSAQEAFDFAVKMLERDDAIAPQQNQEIK